MEFFTTLITEDPLKGWETSLGNILSRLRLARFAPFRIKEREGTLA
jgi:hypothetical protein